MLPVMNRFRLTAAIHTLFPVLNQTVVGCLQECQAVVCGCIKDY